MGFLGSIYNAFEKGLVLDEISVDRPSIFDLDMMKEKKCMQCNILRKNEKIVFFALPWHLFEIV